MESKIGEGYCGESLVLQKHIGCMCVAKQLPISLYTTDMDEGLHTYCPNAALEYSGRIPSSLLFNACHIIAS